MQQRIRKIQELLQRRDLAAAICCRPVNVLACTGFWPVVGDSVAIVTREGACGLLAPEDERELAAHAGVQELSTFQAASLDDLEPVTHRIAEPLRSLAGRLGCPSGRYGHDAGACVEPATYAATFQFGTALLSIVERALGARENADLSDDLKKLRAVLSEPELNTVRKACQAACWGYRSALENIRCGMEERDAAAVLSQSIAAECDESRSGAYGFCMSGPNSADAYRAYQLPGSRRLEGDDIALLHTNSVVGGFWTDITRTYRIGAAHPQADAVQEAVLKATRSALNAIRPGVPAREVDRAAREVMTAAGYGKQFRHATGHGVGFAAIDHDAYPRIHPCSEDVLEAGMVFNVEPAAYFDGEFGIRQCDMVAVRENGCELLTDFDGGMDELRMKGA